MYTRGMSCCGWHELVDLNTWHGTEREFATFVQNSLQGPPCGAVIFTTNVPEKDNNATKLAALIAKNNLGDVVEVPRFINPNTKRTITAFCWVFDKPALARYSKKVLKDAISSLPKWR